MSDPRAVEENVFKEDNAVPSEQTTNNIFHLEHTDKTEFRSLDTPAAQANQNMSSEEKYLRKRRVFIHI